MTLKWGPKKAAYWAVRVKRRLQGMQTGDNMLTKDKMLTADYRPFNYTSCYFHYQVL